MSTAVSLAIRSLDNWPTCLLQNVDLQNVPFRKTKWILHVSFKELFWRGREFSRLPYFFFLERAMSNLVPRTTYRDSVGPPRQKYFLGTRLSDVPIDTLQPLTLTTHCNASRRGQFMYIAASTAHNI